MEKKAPNICKLKAASLVARFAVLTVLFFFFRLQLFFLLFISIGLTVEFRKGKNMLIMGETGIFLPPLSLTPLLQRLAVRAVVAAAWFLEFKNELFQFLQARTLRCVALQFCRYWQVFHLQSVGSAVEAPEGGCLFVCGEQHSLRHVPPTEVPPHQWHIS